MLTKLCNQALKQEIERINALPKDSKFYKANQHLKNLSDSDDKGFGILAGVLGCAGVGFYALDLPFGVTGSSTAVGNFSACGISWDFGAFAAPIAGGMCVDPKSIAGKCYFTLTAFDALEGICTLTLYSDKKKNTLYGIFVGITEGVDVARINGSGKIVLS